jgi:hypothetical protein
MGICGERMYSSPWGHVGSGCVAPHGDMRGCKDVHMLYSGQVAGRKSPLQETEGKG